jgi:hypothetical protein
MVNFKSLVTVLFALGALSASALADIRVDLNGPARFLNECGGTIQATTSDLGPSRSDNINLVLRNVKKCSNFIIQNTNAEYKIPGPDGDRIGSFSINAGNLTLGWNQVKLTVRSNSGATKDAVAIWVNIVPKQPTANYAACYSSANEAAKARYRKLYGTYASTAWSTYLRTSNSGNYVYSVKVNNWATYEVVTSTSCKVLNTQ